MRGIFNSLCYGVLTRMEDEMHNYSHRVLVTNQGYDKSYGQVKLFVCCLYRCCIKCAVYCASISDCCPRKFVRFLFRQWHFPVPLNYTHYDWAPLWNSGLNFSDCGRNVAVFWAHYFVVEYEFNVINDEDVYRAIFHGLQGYFRSHGYDNPPKDQVIKWDENMLLVRSALSYAFYNSGICKMDVCPLLGWEGNSDIAGRGVWLWYFADGDFQLTCLDAGDMCDSGDLDHVLYSCAPSSLHR